MDKLCQCKKDFIRRCLDFMPKAGITPSVIRVTELSIIECLEDQCTCQEKNEVKEYCSTCGEVHGRECPEYYKVIQLDSILHGEEPKPECDHIVGYRNESDEVPEGDDYRYYDHDVIVYLSELDIKADIENFLERKFRCCPLCEISLDWEAIEKKLNLKKDD